MKLSEIKARLDGLGPDEHARRYRACLEQGDHDLAPLAVPTPRAEEYCRRCLTWFADGVAVNAPEYRRVVGRLT